MNLNELTIYERMLSMTERKEFTVDGKPMVMSIPTYTKEEREVITSKIVAGMNALTIKEDNPNGIDEINMVEFKNKCLNYLQQQLNYVDESGEFPVQKVQQVFVDYDGDVKDYRTQIKKLSLK